jgi:hypothetical protein
MSKPNNAVAKIAASVPGVTALPDTNTHYNRMEIPSETSSNIYVVSQARSTGEVQCSCRGWINKRPGRPRGCKHVTAIAPLLQLASQPTKALK